LPANYPPSFNRGSSTGRLVAVTYGGTSAGNYTGYDQLGQVTSSYQQTDGQNYGFSYGYDLASQMTSETYPSGRQITTSYDTAGRISTINGQKTGEPNKTYASQFSYAAHGAAKSLQLGNSKWEHTNFNPRLQPLQIGLGTSQTNSSILQLDYGYGTTSNNANVLSQNIVIGGTTISQTYTYDALNRLQIANESGGAVWSQTYGYDRYGNRWVSNSFGYTLSSLTPQSQGAFNAANNRLFASVYDGAGNQITDSQSRTFTYDAENRQTTFNGTTGQYFYDGDGRRVKKTDNSGTTVFVYNAGGQLIAEYHSDPVPPAPGGGGTSYLTTDHLGSTRVVTKSDGTVKARYDYLPFGEELGAGVGQRTTGMGYSAADSTKQKFTQKERDNESGLDYFGARYYSAPQGRFTSTDPKVDQKRSVIDPQRFNLYVYVRNNPLALIDPDGKQDKGSGGSKVIDIFIALSSKEFRQGNRYTNFSQLKKFGKDHGYTINVHGYNESTFKNVDASLKTAAVTIVDGHGVYAPGDPSKKAYGIQLKDSILTASGKELNFLGYSVPAGDRPTSNVSCLGLFGCNTSYMGSPVTPNGPGLTVVSVDSGPEGGTGVPALTASLQAFVKGYVATDGDVISAVNAGTKALQTSETNNPANKGDKLSLSLYDVNLAPPQEIKVPPEKRPD
jgi:RHS repeat-associated protein